MAAGDADLTAGRNARQIEAARPVPPVAGATIIFMNDMQGVKAVVDHLRVIVPPHLRSTIQPYFAMLDSTVNIRIMAQMAECTLRVLVATKAAELGVNMPGVARVVVWRPKDGLDAVVQQAGRAARQGGQGLVVVYGSSN